MKAKEASFDSRATGFPADSLNNEVTTIRELLDRMAQTRAESSFLISPETGRVLTFRDLQEQASLVSNRLRQLGLERGDKVAFLMDNGLFTAQLFLGTMYGGFASVPLNVRAGVSQLSYMLDHCDAKVVFVGGEYTTLITEVMAQIRRPVQVIPADVDAFGAAGETPLSVTPLAAPVPGDVALLMYTSGSTGHPKAAVHSHRTILAGGRNSVTSHQLTSTDRSLLVLPLYHINAECVTLIPTLLSGGSVVVPHRFSIGHYWDWLDEHRCTWSAVVPTIISQLLDWPDPRADQRGACFERIRFLRSSSAPLAPSLHREFLAKFPLLLIQAMGSSEAGNIFSNPQPPGENKIGSPGLAWGFEVKIVDREGAEVPQGEPGEMLIRGAALTQSYYKEPEATAAAFDTAGWLHTGDLAYRDPDGYFFVVGRSKELIIKGGVNIAPRQIDDVLESHPAVLEAAAVGVPDHHLGEDLAAFVVLRVGVACHERELLAFCESRLGHFKTPTRIHFVEDLPKGPSGKVQRLRLVEEATTLGTNDSGRAQHGFGVVRGSGGVAHDGPSVLPSAVEQTIADAWAEILKTAQLGVHDNFFTLGGDSLLAIQCLSRLRDKLPVRLTLTDFFEKGTIAEQAELVRERLYPAGHIADPSGKSAGGDDGQGSLPAPLAGLAPIPPRDRALPYPLSPLQERLWFMEQLNPGLLVYNEAEAARLLGELNVEALERALNVVIARHEMLRTTIQVTDGQPLAVVHETWPLRLKRIDLSSLTDPQREAEVERLLIAEPRAPYHLQDEPAIRATLIRLGPSEHVFILKMHHLVCDWSSEGVLWRELAVAYLSFCRGESLALPPLPIQYGDYAVWQRQQLTETRSAEDLAFWVENLRGAPALLELPSDRPRPAVMSYRGARKRFRLNRTVTEGLRQLSRREKKSLFALFTAALDTLLYRYTGQEDILLGIPLAERDRPELQSMIGFLLHTHVLRTELTGDMSFRELVACVQQGALKLYEHRSVPFDQVVRAVQPERNLSYSPLFQVMVNWRDRDQDLSFIGLEGLGIESLLAESRISKFDLTLMLTDMGDEIWAEMEYSTDLFDEPTIVRMFGHYQTLLEAVAADPELRLSELPLLTEAERHQLLVEWNDTKVDYPSSACVHELFEMQAQRTPEAVALICEGLSLTYRDLNHRANQLAHALREYGVGPDVIVGIYMERSLEMVVALLGVLKSGGAYVPLDPAYPSDRVAFMLKDTQTPVVVTQSTIAANLTHHPANFICLDSDGPALAAHSTVNPVSTATPDDLAYVIYTSGSTGTPKGVMIEHRGLCNLAVAQMRSFAVLPGSRILQFASISFDASVWEILMALCQGATLCIPPRGAVLAGEGLVQAIVQHAITHVTLPPAVLRTLPEAADLASIQTMIVAGEALTEELAKRWRLGCHLVHAYGPSEATVCATVFDCHVADAGSPPIGRPVANTRVYILDGHGEPVPVGVPGEIHIGGVGVGRGYLNRPELTAERFLPDPFAVEAGMRMYRTGDLGRWLPDRNIEFLGRNDFQVKIRGFRIELGEIEACLSAHPAVRQVVVVLRGEVEKQLVAYVVLVGELACTMAELRDYLKQKLPEYMIPAAWVTLPALPLTPNGKVDRKALPAPGEDAFAARTYEAPQGQVETTIASIWAEVLKVERVDRNDHFFELGGHSLMAVTVIDRMRREGLHANVRALFNTPTLAALAAAVDCQVGLVDVPPSLIPLRCEAITPEMLPLVDLSATEVERIVSAIPGGAANVQDIYPLTTLQEGILFHHLMAGEGDPYLVVMLYGFDSRARLDGYLDAVQAVMDRHDIFRTGVVWEGLREPVQVVWRKAPMPVEEIQFDPADGDVAELFKGLFDPRRHRIDLRQAPLIRAHITYDAANERWLLLMLIHHLVCDHTTLDVMQEEIQAHLLGQANRLPEPLPFRNFVARARLGASREEHEDFFRRMLGDVDETTAPFGLLSVQEGGSTIEEARLELDASLARRIRERARNLGVSAASLFHLAWAQVLARVSGREDVVFGTVLFGRMQGGEGADRVLGLFINTLPARIRVGEAGVEASARATHTHLADLLRHEHASLAMAQRCSAVPARAPLFSALLNYRHSPSMAQAPSAEAMQAWEGIQRLYVKERTNYPLTLSVSDLGEGFILTAQVPAPIGPLRVCQFMHAALAGLVEALETGPATPARNIDVLSESERRRVVEEWNDTKVGFPKGKCIHEMFEAQVDRIPDQVALVFDQHILTYGELNRRANQLAHHLRGLGVGPEVLAGVFVERSLEMLVGVLGILKAGGVYVPMDPSYPKERLGYILQDSQASLVLTQEALVDELPSFAGHSICLDRDWTKIASESQENPVAQVAPEHLAYVLFTSGSTGRPKGVALEHRAAVNFLEWARQVFTPQELAAVLFSTSVCFDLSVFEMFATLSAGGKIIVAPNVLHLATLPEKDEVTLINTVPSAMAELLRMGAVPASVRTVNLAGEALSEMLVDQIYATTHVNKVYNLYGPTETTTYSTYTRVGRGSPVTIGRPITNTKCYILDASGKPVPIGVTGELYIAGVGVARGYYGRPELTNERFVPNPFCGERGGRMYRTGDLCRWLPDGNILYQGRIDHQIKLRGFRIELEEIEEALRQHPGVRDAVVVVREEGEKYLVAYVVPAGEPAGTIAEWRDYLKQKLPDYMVPAAWVTLPSLPLTPNGKVDRKALPAPDTARPAHPLGFVAPRTETEKKLAGWWAEILGLDNISIHDDFFELGGHSLTATRLVSRIRTGLRMDVPLRSLFERPTVAGFSAYLDAIQWTSVGSKSPVATVGADRMELEI